MPLRVAVVHDWLVTYAGAERVLEEILRLFPEADLFSLVEFLPERERDFLGGREVRTSFIQRLPGARRFYRHYLPLMLLAVEQFDLSGYDLVVSSSYAVAKGVITGPDQLHVCMCHSPMRYAWDLQHQYLDQAGIGQGLKGVLARILLQYLRLWDTRSANGVDVFVANSRFVARRIWKVYRRHAEVIYPPVDVEGFTLHREKEDFYLTASRLVPYKRVDLIVDAFSGMPGRQLIVVGDGPEMGRIRARAGPNVRLVGHQPFPVLRSYMQRARAFVFAAEEDFGIAPVEAQACGTPVIAYGRGGVRESVVEGETGIFFHEQSVEALRAAVEAFEARAASFDPARIRRNAERFSRESFRAAFARLVEREWESFARSALLVHVGG